MRPKILRPRRNLGGGNRAVRDANLRLRAALPTGYPTQACEPVARLAGALATIACTVNKDPGGPVSATYSLCWTPMRSTRPSTIWQ